MKNLWTKFTGLSAVWKVIILAAIFIAGVLAYDAATGGLSTFRNWRFDKNTAATMQKVDELTKENDALRVQHAADEKAALELKAKQAVYEANDKAIDQKVKDAITKTSNALAEQDKVEAQTAVPVDNYTRCNNVKQKMLDLKIKGAGDIDCDVYKQN